MKVKTALVSVSDRQGLLELGRALQSSGVEILATSGTAKHLASNGISAKSLFEVYTAPEYMDGRVKSLHPAIYAGILADRKNPKHLEEAAKANLRLIDLVVVNLYPFERTVSVPDHSFEEAIENIDIGGVALIRAAAKNHSAVGIVIDPADYAAVVKELGSNGGALSGPTRRELAVKALRMTAHYDSVISEYLAKPAEFPSVLSLTLSKAADLRYGENPHQRGALYRFPSATGAGVCNAEQLGGVELSYNNLLDTNAAFELVQEFKDPACVIVKHTTPCGTALGATLEEAFVRARDADAKSAFGGIVAVNGTVNEQLASRISTKDSFFEALIAPAIDDSALPVLKGGAKWGEKLRILRAREVERRPGWDCRGLRDGILVQTEDNADVAKFEVAVGTITPEEEADLRFAWTVVKHTKSNAIVLAKDRVTVGIGQGQTSRVDACALATRKAKKRARGSVAASDAFFPFPDGVETLAKAGVKAVIHPGGSIRDKEVVAAAKELGVKMVLTGMRHFRH
ncbi:MAG TPA: bifunctional phosphoribosylaminoimidazolecarboxamide formyltransferase/IMP cyclohydrolase [Planctomycetota bacterium]|nr:bifunctional phosphoribosylaminoimidazolecarboxamide formyltransferase/IMP cyclohydrolase [Planctomycetota bacterium]